MKVPSHFIVIVPGFMGSKLRNRESGKTIWGDFSSVPFNPLEWENWLNQFFSQLVYPNQDLEAFDILDEVLFIPPWAKQEQYNRLFGLLEGMGYKADKASIPERERNVYAFAYDWRQDNRVSAGQLAEAVEQWCTFHPGAKVWMMCHSNGGVVARWYIDKLGGKERVERLFLFGAPWDGCPKAMQALLTGFQSLFIRGFDWFDIPERTKNLVRSFPALYQLIPFNSPFLLDEYNHKVDPYSETEWLDDDAFRSKELLKDALLFNQALSNSSPVETLCFFGRKKPTISVGFMHREREKFWENIDWKAEEPGDGTIPVHSAIYQNAQATYPFSVGHGDIYVNPAVLDVLEWELWGRYHAVKGRTLFPSNIDVILGTDKDTYSPGEEICVRVSIEQDSKYPVIGQVQAQLIWRQPLPISRQRKYGQNLKAVHLAESKIERGIFEGRFIAPDLQGYYDLRVVTYIKGQVPILTSEMISVEGLIQQLGGYNDKSTS